MESEGIREREETEILNDLDVHEAWANQICRKTEEMPVIDWTKKQLQQDEPEEPELSGIDFTGSLMKNCDFTPVTSPESISPAVISPVPFFECDPCAEYLRWRKAGGHQDRSEEPAAIREMPASL